MCDEILQSVKLNKKSRTKMLFNAIYTLVILGGGVGGGGAFVKGTDEKKIRSLTRKRTHTDISSNIFSMSTFCQQCRTDFQKVFKNTTFTVVTIIITQNDLLRRMCTVIRIINR